jgi:hypothetical protein
MNIVIVPTDDSNAYFNLSLTSRLFNLELQDWHLAYLENNDDLIMRFETAEQTDEFDDEDYDAFFSNSVTGFIELINNQDLVIKV